MIPKYDLQNLPEGLARTLRKHLGISKSPHGTSLAAAAKWLRSKRIATLWGGTELPSLHEAVGGELVARMALVSSPAIGKAYVWAKKLVESREFALVKLFRRRATFVARPLWPALLELAPADPEALWRAGGLSSAARHIAAFLLEEGPTNTLELQQALPGRFPILPKSLRKGLRELEEKLMIYPRRVADHFDGKDVNTWELLKRGLAREGQERRREDGSSAVACLIEAAVRAAGVVDARECGRWFPRWKHQCLDALSALARSGRIRAVRERASQFIWHGLTDKFTRAV